MNKIVMFDIYDELRPLQDTLFSWDDVEGKEDWDFIFHVADTYVRRHILDEIDEFLIRNKVKSSRVREGRNDPIPVNNKSTLVVYAQVDKRVEADVLTVY